MSYTIISEFYYLKYEINCIVKSVKQPKWSLLTETRSVIKSA